MLESSSENSAPWPGNATPSRSLPARTDETRHLLGLRVHAHAHARLLALTHRPNPVPAPSQPESLGGQSACWRHLSGDSASSLLCRTRKDPDARQEEQCLRQKDSTPGAML